MNIHQLFLAKVKEINDRLPDASSLIVKGNQQLSFNRMLVQKMASSSKAMPNKQGASYVRPLVPWRVRPYNTAAKADGTISEVVQQAASKFGIDPALIMAVIKAESGFNAEAVSSAGAMGLMQLMPSTAAALGVTDPFDIQQNIFGGTAYLRSMLDRFGNTALALAAYNAGPGSVERYNGIPPYTETQNYVKRVMGYLQDYMA